MDIGKAISFIFNDPDWWKKLLIGTLILMIPIIGLIVLKGWWIEIIKRVAKDDPEPLPSFDNFGELLSNGFRSILVYLVYKSPVIILGTIILVVFFIPFFVVAGDPSDDLVGLLVIYLICGGSFLFPLSIALSFFERAAQMELAVKGELSDAFDLKKVNGVFKVGWAQLILVFISGFVAFWITQPIASAIILIGNLLVSVFLKAFSGHLYGQVYNSTIGVIPAKPSGPIPQDGPDVVTM